MYLLQGNHQIFHFQYVLIFFTSSTSSLISSLCELNSIRFFSPFEYYFPSPLMRPLNLSKICVHLYGKNIFVTHSRKKWIQFFFFFQFDLKSVNNETLSVTLNLHHRCTYMNSTKKGSSTYEILLSLFFLNFNQKKIYCVRFFLFCCTI